jgi:peptide/nickel transport system permease protein
MTATTPDAVPTGGRARRRPGRLAELRTRLGASDLAVKVSLGVLGALVLLAITAPWLPLPDPRKVDIVNRWAPMSWEHLLGTDSNGRDILARLVWGTRTALLGPLVVTLSAVLVGVTLAIVAAWRGGWVDTVVSRLFDVTFAFPGILLALVSGAVFGIGLTSATTALAIAYTPYVGRVTRAAALAQVRLPYIEALLVQGQSPLRICVHHLLPNLSRIVLAQATVTFGYALVDLAALSFLGLGVQQTTPDWGVMVAAGQADILSGHPQQAVYAGIAIIIAVAAFTVVGERLGEGNTEHGTALL